MRCQLVENAVDHLGLRQAPEGEELPAVAVDHPLPQAQLARKKVHGRHRGGPEGESRAEQVARGCHRAGCPRRANVKTNAHPPRERPRWRRRRRGPRASSASGAPFPRGGQHLQPAAGPQPPFPEHPRRRTGGTKHRPRADLEFARLASARSTRLPDAPVRAPGCGHAARGKARPATRPPPTHARGRVRPDSRRKKESRPRTRGG